MKQGKKLQWMQLTRFCICFPFPFTRMKLLHEIIGLHLLECSQEHASQKQKLFTALLVPTSCSDENSVCVQVISFQFRVDNQPECMGFIQSWTTVSEYFLLNDIMKRRKPTKYTDPHASLTFLLVPKRTIVRKRSFQNRRKHKKEEHHFKRLYDKEPTSVRMFRQPLPMLCT